MHSIAIYNVTIKGLMYNYILQSSCFYRASTVLRHYFIIINSIKTLFYNYQQY